MSKSYRELVAVQAIFSKVVAQYRLVHYYKWKSDEWISGVLSLVGYDMDRAQSPKGIAEALRNAYAPATLSIWKHDGAASSSELLQLTVGARPGDLGLEGTWSLWAEL